MKLRLSNHSFANAVLLSVLAHCIIFGVLSYVYRESEIAPEKEIDVTLILDTEKTDSREKPEFAVKKVDIPLAPALRSNKNTETIPESSAKAELVFDDTTNVVRNAPDSLHEKLVLVYDILNRETDSLRLIPIRRQMLYDEILENLTNANDSSRIAHKILASNLSNMLLGRKTLENEKKKEEYIEKKLGSDLYNSDPQFAVSVPEILSRIQGMASSATHQKHSKPQKPKLTVLPTLAEVSVLKALWEKDKITQNMIYADLDTAVKLTAEDLNHVLDGMVEKGWVTRKKISPQNIMKVMTPVGAVDVEMSPLNRKNPVYEYSALAERNDVLRFLDSQLFLARAQMKNKTATDSTLLAESDSLLAKVLLLIKSK
ncbi:BlaI/MecI/CopY family transcriptional regulator [candidate division KSB1 bacterium]|nr:BlaI/MecI/CopY family transcriptional regulator [candidate division KSB1 bacterium]